MSYQTPVSLMLSCRQINAEAALLQFQLNEFGLFSFEHFNKFTDRLSGRQRDAIQRIRLEGGEDDENVGDLFEELASYWRDGRDKKLHYKRFLPLGQLRGLKKIVWEYQ